MCALASENTAALESDMNESPEEAHATEARSTIVAATPFVAK